MNKFLLLTMTLIILMSALSIAESDTVWSKEIGSEVKTVKFSPDGQFIYAAAIGRKPMKLSTETGEILREYEGFVFEGNVFFLAMDISSDGKWLVCGAYGNNMYIFDTETGLIVKTLKTDYQEIQSNKFNTVTITPDKHYIVATNMFAISPQETMNGIVIWDAISGELIKVINSKDAMKVEASPDNIHLAVSYYDESPTEIKIYQIGSWVSDGSLCCQSSLIQDISYSPDGSLLASCSYGGEIKIWDLIQNKIYFEMLTPHGENNLNGNVFSVNFYDNTMLISGGSDFNINEIRIWKLGDSIPVKRIQITYPINIDNSYQNKLLTIADYQSVTLLDLTNITNISEISNNDIKASPNPSKNLVNIIFNLPQSGKTQVEILDLNSNQISLLYAGFMDAGNQNLNWFSKGIPSGTYFCRITGKNFSKTLKIILEK